jgi:adenylate kinase
MNVLLIGPPGSGKGTQGARLATRLGLRHIAAGDVLREQVAARTSIGLEVADHIERGELVPDEVIIDLLLPVIRAAARGAGYLLDGFPRSVEQAEQVRHIVDEEHAAADAAIYLDAPHELLIGRIMERARVEGRSDDTAEVIDNRLKIFEEETRPLIDYYRGRGVLHMVDATRAPAEVTRLILAALGAV